jgi:hypothetical protein
MTTARQRYKLMAAELKIDISVLVYLYEEDNISALIYEVVK